MAAAVGRAGRAALERVYAPEYIYIHGTAYQNDRATHIIGQLAADSATRAEFAARVPAPIGTAGELYVYGDVAVQRVAGTTPTGRPFRTVTIYAKRDGRWRDVQAQNTLLQPERTAVPVATAVLDEYAGDYGIGPDGRTALSIVREGAALVARGVPVPFPRALTPVGDARFYDKLGLEYTFVRGADRVTHVETRYECGPPRQYERRP